ncbi:MAG: DNA-3-methyladenine glycosylase [Candidatus Heteroscillospira sp.]|jgi:DNA-3-methyladenine glycosylase
MRLAADFFHRDCLELAPALVGKLVCRKMPDGSILRLRITETEAYRGEEDTACHAHKGRTKRTEILYGESGLIYVYLCYGMHWLMNVISGETEQPQGVLIRACEGYGGPGKLTKALSVDGSFNRRYAYACDELWFEDDGCACKIITDKRVGIGYASEADKNRLWRFKLSN